MTTTEKRPPTLTGSQDLLTYFNLIPIYNKVVKPYPPDNRSEGLDQSLFPYVSDLPGNSHGKKSIMLLYTLLMLSTCYKKEKMTWNTMVIL